MTTRRTAVVEPNPGGHRFQYASHVARVALARGDEVVLVTSKGASEAEQFPNFFGALAVEVDEALPGTHPSVEEAAEALVALHRDRPLTTYVVTEGDVMLRSWWRKAPRELRAGRGGGPEGVFLYSRFPSRISWEDRTDVAHRIAKTAVALLARVRRRAVRVAYLVGRDDPRPGRLLERVRDPAICSAHARDRGALRERFGLPHDRRYISILGSISMRKCPPMVLDAAIEAGPDVDLLLGGQLWDDVAEWFEHLEPAKRSRIEARLGFLSEEEIDAYVAASDIIVAAHLNRGPSGVMGKAQVAGVPTLSAGSKIRGREATAQAGGVHTDLTASAIAAGIREILARGREPVPVDPSLPTAEEFGAVLLGLPPAPSLLAARRR